ncbi:MAG TPA: hypothetical protein VEV41_05400 [Terriglobales bacterium]|nr:hypothetical protein [Terriglobales bacterium]
MRRPMLPLRDESTLISTFSCIGAPAATSSLARGEPNRKKIALTTLSDKVREVI